MARKFIVQYSGIYYVVENEQGVLAHLRSPFFGDPVVFSINVYDVNFEQPDFPIAYADCTYVHNQSSGLLPEDQLYSFCLRTAQLAYEDVLYNALNESFLDSSGIDLDISEPQID